MANPSWYSILGVTSPGTGTPQPTPQTSTGDWNPYLAPGASSPASTQNWGWWGNWGGGSGSGPGETGGTGGTGDTGGTGTGGGGTTPLPDPDPNGPGIPGELEDYDVTAMDVGFWNLGAGVRQRYWEAMAAQYGGEPEDYETMAELARLRAYQTGFRW